ncbi:MAG: alpha/beta fold hydrolase [Chloroflexi bacterium]|nr:alpha/beta fold hydrolase [Chloroflexota bacterium]
MSITSNFIQVLGVRTHYLTAGAEGSPVLLLHGGGTDSAWLSWSLAAPALAQTHRVIAPDWPGYGDSERPDVGYSTDYYVGFLLEFMARLDLPRASLVGISMGGAIALGAILRQPERVERLVLVDSYGLQPTAPAHKLSWLFVRLPGVNALTWALVRNSRAMARASLTGIFHDPRRVTDDLVDQVLAEMRKPRTGAAFMAFQRHDIQWQGLRTFYLDRLHEIAAPALIIHGERDSLVPLACARQAQQRIRGARLEALPGCGHWPQREKPEEFNRLVASFLAAEEPPVLRPPAGGGGQPDHA